MKAPLKEAALVFEENNFHHSSEASNAIIDMPDEGKKVNFPLSYTSSY